MGQARGPMTGNLDVEPGIGEARTRRSSGFVPAQLVTMSHHFERAQHAAVERGAETFTLLVWQPTYAALEFQPPIPPRYEDRWIQTVATNLGRVLGFNQPPRPAEEKDPWEAHLTHRNWRLVTSSAVSEMGVSNNQKWGPPPDEGKRPDHQTGGEAPHTLSDGRAAKGGAREKAGNSHARRPRGHGGTDTCPR